MVFPINTALQCSYSSLFPSSLPPLPLNGFPAMLSTFPATFSSDSFIGNHQTPLFDTGFPPWEYHEPSFLFAPLSPQQQEPVIFTPQPSQEPASPNSGSGTSTPAQDPGSNEPNPSRSKNNVTSRNNSKNSSSGSDDERKRKRMISNRESARRSRMRKVKHLENLRSKANRLKVGNRDLMNRLRLLVQQGQFVLTENECLQSEAVMLRRRLCDIRQLLLLRQLQQHFKPSAWPCTNNPTSINQGQLINY